MYLLDTSAILVHCFGETGADEVDRILVSNEGYVAAVTWFELRVKLQDSSDARLAIETYAEAVAGTVDITADVAVAAYKLRESASSRIPAADCLIAGAAVARGYRLVHRDAHLAAIPTRLLPQILLPPRA